MDTTAVAIVTGGAGSIGTAIGRRLIDLGFRLVVADMAPEAVERTVTQLGAAGSFVADLTRPDAVLELFQTAMALGPVHVVVNSLGISPKHNGAKKPFDLIDADEWQRVFAVNVLAPFLVIREAAQHMPTNGVSSIVNIGSITARLGAGGAPDTSFPPHTPSAAHYAASKAALHNLGMSLSRELAPKRIRVNTVAPGYVATAMTSEVPNDDGARILSQVPLGRAAVPDDVANAVDFLISDRATYMTGAVIDVNGGWLPAF